MRRLAESSSAERLLDLAERLQDPDVVSEARGRGADSREHGEHPVVDLPGVRLPDDVIGAREPEARREPLVEPVDLAAVPLEQFEEGRLGPRRPPRASEAEFRPHCLHLLEIEEQILEPQAGALPDRHGLGRLQVRVAERGHAGLRAGEGGQVIDRAQQPLAHDLQALEVLDQAVVVAHEGARRAEMDVLAGLGRDLAEMMHVRHDVVPQFALDLGDPVEVDLLARRVHGHDRRVGNVDAERPLLLGEGDPQVAPDERLHARGEDRRHVARGVAVDERMWVATFRHQARCPIQRPPVATSVAVRSQSSP